MGVYYRRSNQKMHPINATKRSNHLRLQAFDNTEVI